MKLGICIAVVFIILTVIIIIMYEVKTSKLYEDCKRQKTIIELMSEQAKNMSELIVGYANTMKDISKYVDVDTFDADNDVKENIKECFRFSNTLNINMVNISKGANKDEENR